MTSAGGTAAFVLVAFGLACGGGGDDAFTVHVEFSDPAAQERVETLHLWVLGPGDGAPGCDALLASDASPYDPEFRLRADEVVPALAEGGLVVESLPAGMALFYVEGVDSLGATRASGCAAAEVDGGGEITVSLAARGTSAEPTRQVDVLFVIDDSAEMEEEQQALVGGFGPFAGALLGAGLDLHVGVVSSDLGGYQEDLSGCSGEGDRGILQASAQLGSCSPPAGSFIRDVAPDGCSEDACRERNYAGTMADTFACIAQLGTAGCGFEQHLESMRRALDGSNPENAGFLRQDSLLAVIFLAQEDDCSAQDRSLFQLGDATIDGELGPYAFRCFEFGVLCDGGPVSRSPGSYDSCEPRGDTYLHHPQVYSAFLKQLRPDPDRLVVATIVGNPAPVAVELSPAPPEQLAPAPSCTGPLGTAAPAIRFGWFAGQFGSSGLFRSVCDGDMQATLDLIAGRILERLER